ncbi:BNR repeat-containing protein [Pontibacter toksunensis]|uniref:BNR repeat-containing protein n=1 Tax=Pontibacter toksunensis TaxID=1332631 RepID=A0ABW6C2W5_9BACT
MNRTVFLLLFYFTVAISSFSQSTSSDVPTPDFQTNTITDKGAWCWFADPRAVHFKNKKGTIDNTYIGYIDTHRNIKATQINHLTNTTNEVLVRSYFQPDDHNNPTFLVLPDERIMIFYSRHTDEPCFYYRISSKKGDITTLGKEVRLVTADNTTYPSPFILSDDPEHIYLAWRGINWHPTIARLTLPDADGNVKFDWGPYQMVRSKKGQGGTRPYAKYLSNGKDKIYLAYTTTHPDNQSVNYIYFNYLDINTKELKDVKGNSLSVIGGAELHDIDATKAYKDSHPYAVVDDSPFRNWLWELSADKAGKPVIAMVSISENKKSHDYHHVRWTGSEWQKTFIANGGGHFHQTPEIEQCYSGGMAIDKTNPQVVYGSVPVDGKYGRVYELKKYTVGTDGKVGAVQQLTFDSPKNNVRPYMT